MIFYLGIANPLWFAKTHVPTFLSYVQVRGRRKAVPRANAPWCLDSGGFSEITAHGKWTVPPREYDSMTRRLSQEVGMLRWAAPQDWMCEDKMLIKTGLTIAEHQRRTTASYLDLKDMSPDLPYVPVLQGFSEYDYLKHIELYQKYNVDLWNVPTVGVGTMCRRQGTLEAAKIINTLYGILGLRIHAFGFKIDGLLRCFWQLQSSDSMAWSFSARHLQAPLVECIGLGHINCANCLPFALKWRDDLLCQLQAEHQGQTPNRSFPALKEAAKIAGLAERSLLAVRSPK